MSDSIWSTIKGVIGTVAPVVASMVGTPLAGMAVAGLCDVLGLKADAKPEQIETALKNAPPETWLKIKQLESDTKIRLQELEIDAQQIEQVDRDSARKREADMAKTGFRDYTPPILAIGATLGFFGLLSLMLFHTPDPAVRGLLDIMLGSLGTVVVTIYTYYFGSSKSSSNKDKYLAAK